MPLPRTTLRIEDDMGINIKVNPEIELKSRINVLYNVVKELSLGFGADAQAAEVIKKGVLNRQLFDSIEINYMNSEDKVVGRVTIDIDWDKHDVRASSESGKNFQLDPSKSVSEQITHVYKILTEHTEKLRKAYGVKKILTRYGLRTDLYKDQQKLAEAKKYLNMSDGASLTWSEKPPSHSKDKKLDLEIKFISELLDELKITIEHNKPK